MASMNPVSGTERTPPSSNGGNSDADTGGPFTPDFRKLVAETLDKWHVPGMSIAVVDGEETFLKGFGLADVASQTPVTPDTLFMMGSTTKAFTAAVLGMLIDSGDYTTPPATGASPSTQKVPLSWRTPISSIIPEDFVLSDPWATAHITLEDATVHRTGLPRHDSASASVYTNPTTGAVEKATVRALVRTLRYLPMANEPRSTWEYCNLMYITLSHCIETLTGRGLDDEMRERVFAPLGMDASFWGIEDMWKRARPDQTLARGYYWDTREDGGGLREIPPDPMPESSGAGLIISSARDYGRWLRCLLDEGLPLSKAVHEAVRTPKMVQGPGRGVFDAPKTYAGGWDVASYRGHRVFTHGGMEEAYGTLAIFFPDDGFGVASMANTAVGSAAANDMLLWRLVDERLGIPEEKRVDWGKRWEGLLGSIEHSLDNPLDMLFPNLTSKPLPVPLPLDAYVGGYYHPAYQTMTVELGVTEGTLQADRRDFTWKSVAEFKHVSGEYWVMHNELSKTPGGRYCAYNSAVEFKVGVDGKVNKMGVEFRGLLTQAVDGWIWFDRID